MRTRPIIVLIAVLVFGFAAVAYATNGSITLDFTVVRDAPGSVHELYSGPMPVVGEECQVTAADSGNNTSVHPGNHLQLSTGGGTIFFNDVERAPNVSTPGSASIVPGENGVVTLTLGPDGVYSADLTLEFTCTTTTTTTAPSTSTSSSTTTTPTSSSTTTTTIPASTTTAPIESTTTTLPSTTTLTSECVDIPGEVICELPFTGPESDVMVPVALGLLLAGLATLGYARRES